MDIKISFPDNKVIDVKSGITVSEAITLWDKSALDSAVAVNVDKMPADLSSVLDKDCSVDVVDINSDNGLDILRHSISHVMAHAVQAVFKGTKVSIGPSIENGFYYDFEYEKPFTTDDFTKIEKKMKEIISADYPFIREELERKKAIELFASRKEDYKVELINDLPADVKVVSIYKDGDYMDLCRGPHIPSTGKIKAFKLLSVAGAYWRGDEKNKMLQRIYGTGFADEKSLNDFLTLLEEAKKRDHRRLGKELDLFQINEEAGAGLIIFHPKGMMLRYLIEDWEKKEHLKRGYEMVWDRKFSKLICGRNPAIMNIIVRTCISQKLTSRLTG